MSYQKISKYIKNNIYKNNFLVLYAKTEYFYAL